jgi:hypothetical protein
MLISFNARVAGGWGLGVDSPVPIGAAVGDAPVLAHTLSLVVRVAIPNPTYSKKKTNNHEPEIILLKLMKSKPYWVTTLG